jgi:hypothetical protein
MPINIPPQLQLQGPRSSGSTNLMDSFVKGIQAKSMLEDLAAKKAENEKNQRVREAATGAVEETPNTMTSEDGSTINLGTKKSANPNKYVENLKAAGEHELADKVEKAHMEHEQEKQQLALGDAVQALDLWHAGDKKSALTIINKHADHPGELVTDIQTSTDPKTNKMSAKVIHKDGSVMDIPDMDTFRNSIVDAKTKYSNDQETKRQLMLHESDPIVFDDDRGMVTQKVKATGEVKLLGKWDSKSERLSSQERQKTEELWRSYNAHPYVQEFNSVKSGMNSLRPKLS